MRTKLLVLSLVTNIVTTISAAAPAHALPALGSYDSQANVDRTDSCRQALLRTEDKLLLDINELKAEINSLNRKLSDKYHELDETQYALKQAKNVRA